MDRQKQYNGYHEAMELLTEQGFDGMGEAMRILFNQAMLIEREHHLNAQHYERCNERLGHANGFKSKTVKTRIGALELSVPQVREGDFYPSCLEKGLRSERALNIACAEMYVQGVSTRKVSEVVEKMCGFSVSSTQVSRAAADLDEAFEKWRNRPLGEYVYCYFDARYESVRHGGHVVDSAVLTAIGINPEGRREVIGVSVALSESEVHWREFFKSLVNRGLYGVKLIISDDHSGMKAARKSIFPTIPWQRCQFHLQQNAQGYVPKKDMKEEVASDIRAIFNAPNREEADRFLSNAMKKYEKSAPKLSEWMEKNVSEGLTVFEFPRDHQKRLRTSNVCERLNKEIKKRSRVVSIFPNDASCLRLVTAVVMEISEDWTMGNTYLNLKT